MQCRRLWYRGGLGLALTIGAVSYLEPQATIHAVPQSQASVNQSMSSTASVFSDGKSELPSISSHQDTPSLSDSQVDKHPVDQRESELSNRSSTMQENADKDQQPDTAITRAPGMVNGTVKLTLDADGTLHLSGGSFGSSVGNDQTGGWIAQALTANGNSPAQVLKVVIDGRITTSSINSYDYLFAELVNLTNIDGLANLGLSNVTSLKYLFKEDQHLQQVDFGQQNFSKVQSFEGMFYDCSALTDIANIGQWQMTSATNLAYMFYEASSLTTLSIDKWNTSRVTNLQYTFCYCSALTTLDVADWDTRNVTVMGKTFRGLTNIKSLPIDKWQTGRVYDMQLIFANDTSLETVNVGNWDTSQVESLDNAFARMTSLTTLPIENWNTSKLTRMQGTFSNLPNLTTLPIGKWDVSHVTTLDATFLNCAKLTTLPVANWNTQSNERLGSTFAGMSSLTTLPIANWNTQNVQDMSATFSGVSSLTTLPVTNWNTQNVKNMNDTFAEMQSVAALPIDNWNTGKVTTMAGTFRKVTKVDNLPIDKWDTSQVTNMSKLFSGDTQLTSLPIDNWNTSSATNFSQMFAACSGLQTLNLGKWNTAKVTNYESTFANTNLEKLDLQSWDTTNEKSHTNAFSGKLPPKRLLLGKSFSFRNSTAWKLPDPSHEAPYVGRWHSLNDNKVYTSTDLMTKYDGTNIVGEFEWATGRTITVKYVDANGKSLAPDTKIAGITGEDYHVKPIEIEGYQPDQPDGVRGAFTDKDETITLTYGTGNLVFVSAPKTIDFGNNPITGQSEDYGATYDTGLVIQDNRSLGSTWSLTATLAANGFKGETSARSLAAVLSYKDQQTGSDVPLLPGVSSLIVNDHHTVSNQGVNVLGSTTPLGALYLKVPTDRVLTDTYQTTVTWTLNQAVPNR